MITVSILINGEPIYTRTAVNRLKKHGVYILDTGERVLHHPDDGAVALAIKMLHTVADDPDELTLCENCLCMTNTWHGGCTRCRAKKRRK
jgi:hypothetical protein